MRKSSQIEVEMVFLTKAEGGREKPPILTPSLGYGPAIVADDGDYYPILFKAAPETVHLGVPFTATLELRYYPRVDYAPFVSGVEFTFREGPKVVARGRVTKRLYEDVA